MDLHCPITLTANAQKFLNDAAKERKIPSTRPLRIKQKVSHDVVDFEIYHDNVADEGEKVYKLADMSVVLDNDTAFQLIGSTLDVLEDNSLKFTHLDTTDIDMSLPN